MSLTINDVMYLANLQTDFVASLDDNGNYIYVGNGLPGADYDEPKWQIKKFMIAPDGQTPIEGRFADGSPAFDKVWSNKGDYDYKGV